MRKNMKWLIASIVAGLLVIAIAIPALAAGPNSGTPSPTVQPGSGKGNCQGLGAGVNEAVTELLGMTREQIQEQRQAGESLVQIATDKNITEADLINAIMAEKQAAVREMVTAGTITQAQANQRLAQMEERVELAVNRTTLGPQEWAGANGNNNGVGQNGQCNGTGVTNQGGLNGNQENCTATPGTCTGAGSMLRAGRNAR
jgi:Spy/CpxP family protein refolding chaperone